MASSPSNSQSVVELPRGGYLVDTSIGYIQLGSPPETIKDTMGLDKKTPLVFILPRKFFHLEKGISVAELEFPIYYNFFFRGSKKTTVVCSEEQKNQLSVVLRESLMGPEEVDLASEFPDGEESYGFPNIKKEMAFFRSYKSMNEVVEFKIFGKDNSVNLNGVTIKALDSGEFLIRDGELETILPGEVNFHIKYDIGKRLEEAFQPPLLGITCLGPSHGFDPNDNTSGFIIWLNGQGIMVDPPVNSTEWLRESNVNPKLINSIILTHCHADHDAGTFQKILEESKITIYATATVMESFLRKYCSLTNIPRSEISELFEFHSVVIGRPTMINGGEFFFHYAVHSIPSVGFEFFFQDQSFYYTSDHLNDPQTFDVMKEKGVFTESRYQFIKDFPWDRNIIYHEAGVPPLHTKISYLASLPKEVQKRVTVYHIAKKDMPDGTDLTLATFGIENTLYPSITAPKHLEAYRLLEIMSQIDIFSGFPIEKAKEFLQIVTEKNYKRGEQIIKKGTFGDQFFIIASGNVRFEGLENEYATVKRYGTYEYFGEASLVLDTLRQADVYAETEVNALTIEKNRFLQFIRGSQLYENLIKLNFIRESNSWKILTESKVFRGLTSYQVTQLELLLKLEVFQKNKTLIEQDKVFHSCYIIRSGTVSVMQGKKTLRELKSGDFVGEIYRLTKKLTSTYTFLAHKGSDLYSLGQDDAIRYIQKNPGVYMKLNAVYS